MAAKKAVKKKTDVLKAKTVPAAAILEKTEKVKPVKLEPQETITAQAQENYMVIDHPVNNERLYGSHYAIKMGASEGIVEIQINTSAWMACRHTNGYWWFDWVNFAPGKYKITARLKDNKDKVLKKSTIVKIEAL